MKVQVIITIDYDTSASEIDDTQSIVDNLEHMVNTAAGNGDFDNSIDATVESWDTEIKITENN